MKIPPFDPGVAAQEPTRLAPTGVQAARWRQTLEQAQWRQLAEQRGQGRAHAPAEDARGRPENRGRLPAGPAGPAFAQAPAQPSAPAVGEKTTGCTVSEPREDGAAAAAPAPPGDVTAAAAPALTAAAVPMAAVLPSPAPASGVSEVGSAAPSLPRLADALIPAPWPPFNAQAHVEGRAVSAAVRDPRLATADADELERRLAAQLAADGLELVELRVNGRVAGTPPRDRVVR